LKFSLQLGRFNFRVGFDKPATEGKRTYSAAVINRLTSDWSTTTTSADVEARNDIKKLRSRCRELDRDDPYARRYFKLLKNNVLGRQGIRLQMKAKDADGSLDSNANTVIEDGWRRWGKKENCTVQRSLTWRAVCLQVLMSPARDGGVLVRVVEGFKNDFNFALQLVEIDHLDVDYSVPNVPNPTGGKPWEIRMGVELNEWREPMAYHLWTRHPGDYNSAAAFKRERIEAKEIVHLYLPERVMQTIGLPWITASMLRLNMLNGYEEAELVAARVGACKGGYVEKDKPENYHGDAEDTQGNQVEEMEPGTVRELDPGQHFVEHDPKHPTAAYPAYVKGVLRGAASGMAVSYTSLANDLEGVNFSSIRAGLLEDREEYMMTQEWFIEDFCDVIFERWLPIAMLTGQVKLPMAKKEKFLDAKTWQSRRWAWVDPLNDIQATVMAIQNRLESRTGAVADQGGDFEDLLNEIEEEERLAEEKDVELPSLVVPGQVVADNEEETAAGKGSQAEDDEEEPAKPKPKKTKK
jgi:lambda family phage portal protein